MKSYRLESNAKINMGLNITGVLDNGYHLLDMIMLPIDLQDELKIDIFNDMGDLEIKTNKKEIPTNEKNILYMVYKAFYNAINKPSMKMRVYLHKIIPSQAGLGGGSSNGAVFLKFLNEYYGCPLSYEKLIELGKKIGADIPFFIKNRPARAKGIGEKLQLIKNNVKLSLVLIKPDFGMSTVSAYNSFKKISTVKMANIDAIMQGLKENNITMIEKSIENSLEQSLLNTNEQLKMFKNRLDAIKNIKFFMSGSGSVYYGFLDKNNIEIINILKNRFNDCKIYFCNFK